MSAQTLPWDALRCPYCGERLEQNGAGARCRCGETFEQADALDLRPTRPIERNVSFTLGEQLEVPLTVEPFQANPNPEVDFNGAKVPFHLTAELLSWFPRASEPGAKLLDLGCGDGSHRSVCEHAGFEWVGVDHSSYGAPILADAHALPFADQSFEAILSIAVLEHIRYPFVMLREAFRVLRPGGRFIGTVAFLEPHHGDSFYHHSHLAMFNGLAHAGFDVEVIATPVKERWSGLRAQARMSLFPGLPNWFTRAVVWPVHTLHRLWWKVWRRRHPEQTEAIRQRDTTGAFFFVASRPTSRASSST